MRQNKKQYCIINYTCYYITACAAGVNIYDAHCKIDIITHVCNHAPRLYNEALTLAYLQSIYAKTCKDVVDEYKKALEFEAATAPPKQQQQQKPLDEVAAAIKILIITACIGFIVLYNIFRL